MMRAKILYLTQTRLAADMITARYPREIVTVKPLAGPMGHRGEVVVIEPPHATLSERERQQFELLVSEARNKCPPGVPMIMGELI
jgi:hypothetical protein